MNTPTPTPEEKKNTPSSGKESIGDMTRKKSATDAFNEKSERLKNFANVIISESTPLTAEKLSELLNDNIEQFGRINIKGAVNDILSAMQEYADLHHASKMKERAGIGAKELAAETIMKLHTSGEKEWHIFITEAIEKYHADRSFISEESGIDIEYLIIQACKEYENTTPDTYPNFVEKVKEISKSIAHQFPSQPSPLKLPTSEEIKKEFPLIEGEHNLHCEVGAKWGRDETIKRLNASIPLPLSPPTDEQIDDTIEKDEDYENWGDVDILFYRQGMKDMRDKWSSSLTGQQEGVTPISGGWISVEKELPKIDSNVLCLFKN